MIEKVAEYVSGDYGQEVFTLLPKDGNNEGILKTASYDPAVSLYLDSLKREDGYLYALINALTAGEFYGPNRNGDFFPEDALKKYHHTFVEHGHVYKHHVNKDPSKSMGKVIFSHYNPNMRRVEIVVKLKKDHDDVKKLISEINEGRLPKTSMGCKVPYDVCSITKVKAKTRAEYSDYLKYQMNKVLSDGRRVYAINTIPRFFDISIVTIPADPVSSVMAIMEMDKTASVDEPKHAQINKQVPAKLTAVAEDPKHLIHDTQENFSEKELKKLAEYPLNEVLSTMLALRVMPKREDFQKLALYRQGSIKEANQLQKEGKVFNLSTETIPAPLKNVGPEFANEKIAEVFSENISKYSLTKPFIINRIVEKYASLKDFVDVRPYPNAADVQRSFINNLLFDDKPKPADSGVKDPTALFFTLGTLYAGYAKLFGDTANVTEFTKFIGKNRWVAPIMGAGLGLAIKNQQEKILNPVNADLYKEAASPAEKFVTTFVLAAPVSYYQSAKFEEKARRGQPISKAEDFVRRNPFLTAVGGTMAWRGLARKGAPNLDTNTAKSVKNTQKSWGNVFNTRFKGAEYLNSLGPETINSIYNEIIS